MYIIKKTVNRKLDLFDKEWDKANVAEVTCINWEEFPYAPYTTAKILYNDYGIWVQMQTDEKDIIARCTTQNGPVSCDSCMEFFFKPYPWSTKYINFELNPQCVAHIGLGKDRYDRLHIEEDRKTFDIESIPNDGDWTLKYYIPDAFLHKYFENIHYVCRANFYKCADATDHKHYTAWAPVEVVRPDYHVPDFFGFIEL